MRFDESKVFHPVNALDAEEYKDKQGWFSEDMAWLRESVRRNLETKKLLKIENEYFGRRYVSDDSGCQIHWTLFYPATDKGFKK